MTFVTGTDTGVGKTLVTAALAACAAGSVAVVKPVQTGARPDEPGDVDVVGQLVPGITTIEFARYPDPLSPEAAARLRGLPELELAEVEAMLGDLRRQYDSVFVEGAGGLLVRFASDGWTLRDLVRADDHVVLVTRPALGTLNHTELTLRELDGPPVSLVIGDWPPFPGLAELSNVADLHRIAPLRGVLPHAVGGLPNFPEHARAALAPELGGTLDVAAFVRKARQELDS